MKMTTDEVETNRTKLDRSFYNSEKKCARRFSFLDLFTYLFCTVSLAISTYTYYYQLSVKSELIKYSHLENKLEALQLLVDQLQLQQQHHQQQIQNEAQGMIILPRDDDFTNVGNVVRKVALQEYGLERLKRDVSHLKLSNRREHRQAPLQQSPECICPAGNYCFLLLAIHFLQFREHESLLLFIIILLVY